MTEPADRERDRFGRIGELFHQALEAPAGERDAFFDALRRVDPDMAAEVVALVEAHHRAADFIEQPALAAPSPVVLPRTPIGHYRVLGLIGAGGMGVVYLAEDTRLGRTVALKAVRTEFAHDEKRIARLRREARAAAALSHPNVATVYALEEIEGRLYVASEFVAGDTLRDEIDRGPVAPARVLSLTLAMASALSVAHDAGVVHRDLKPENVVVTPKGDVKVLDFGLAQFADPDGDDAAKTEDGAVMGTPGYMSPEQIRGAAVDGRADLFALGIIVYELATGQHPFAAPTPAATIARVLESRTPALADAVPDGVRRDSAIAVLETIVTRCLEKSAASRPPNAAAVVEMIEGAMARSAGAEAPAYVLPGGAHPNVTRAGAEAPAYVLPGGAHPNVTRAGAEAPAVVLSGGAHPNVGLGFSPGAVRPDADASGPHGVSGRPADPSATWWWQFHQGATTLAYVLLLLPLWRVRTMTDGAAGMAFFIAALVAVVIAGMLRLHLWFALRQYPDDWPTDHHLSRRLILLGDIIFALALAARGFTAIRIDDPSAVLLIAAAASVAVSFVIIEPATTGAMRGRQGR